MFLASSTVFSKLVNCPKFLFCQCLPESTRQICCSSSYFHFEPYCSANRAAVSLVVGGFLVFLFPVSSVSPIGSACIKIVLKASMSLLLMKSSIPLSSPFSPGSQRPVTDSTSHP